MSESTLKSPPRRGIAIALAFLGCGLGHVYAGLPRRALAWLAWALVGGTVLAAALPALGMAIGYRAAFLVFVFFGVTAWAGPVTDLARMRMGGLVARPAVHVVLVGIGLAVAATVVKESIRGFLLEAFNVPSASMTPTVLVGDHLLVDKRAYRGRAPRRGDVIVFASPEHPAEDYVKRVIALPGDQLTMKDGHPSLDGWEVPHCQVGAFTFPAQGDARESTGDVEVEFLDGHAYLTFYETQTAAGLLLQGPFQVSADGPWVLGDNRNNSSDSRSWFGGAGGGVPPRMIKGRAIFTWWHDGPDGIDVARIGESLTEPRLPPSMHALDAGLARCLATAPPDEKTVPPKP